MLVIETIWGGKKKVNSKIKLRDILQLWQRSSPLGWLGERFCLCEILSCCWLRKRQTSSFNHCLCKYFHISLSGWCWGRFLLLVLEPPKNVSKGYKSELLEIQTLPRPEFPGLLVKAHRTNLIGTEWAAQRISCQGSIGILKFQLLALPRAAQGSHLTALSKIFLNSGRRDTHRRCSEENLARKDIITFFWIRKERE